MAVELQPRMIAIAALLLDLGSEILAWLQWNRQPEPGMPGQP